MSQPASDGFRQNWTKSWPLLIVTLEILNAMDGPLVHRRHLKKKHGRCGVVGPSSHYCVSASVAFQKTSKSDKHSQWSDMGPMKCKCKLLFLQAMAWTYESVLDFEKLRTKAIIWEPPVLLPYLDNIPRSGTIITVIIIVFVINTT